MQLCWKKKYCMSCETWSRKRSTSVHRRFASDTEESVSEDSPALGWFPTASGHRSSRALLFIHDNRPGWMHVLGGWGDSESHGAPLGRRRCEFCIIFSPHRSNPIVHWVFRIEQSCRASALAELSTAPRYCYANRVWLI